MSRASRAVAAALLVGSACALAGQGGPALPAGSSLGHEEAGAAVLAGYLVKEIPCLPVKRFTAEAGYRSNVSPSRRSFGVLVGPKTSLVLEMKAGLIDGKRFELSVPAFEREGDFFVPLEFFEKAFPARFTFDRKRRTVTALLPGRTVGARSFPAKTVVVPIRPLPAARPR